MKLYTPPGSRRRLMVDAALDGRVLDRLNRLPDLRVVETCAGHGRGPETRARVVFVADMAAGPRWWWGRLRPLLLFGQYLERLSATEYRAQPSRYRSNGAPAAWHLEVRRDEPGPAPRAWWAELVDLLEDPPDRPPRPVGGGS